MDGSHSFGEHRLFYILLYFGKLIHCCVRSRQLNNFHFCFGFFIIVVSLFHFHNLSNLNLSWSDSLWVSLSGSLSLSILPLLSLVPTSHSALKQLMTIWVVLMSPEFSVSAAKSGCVKGGTKLLLLFSVTHSIKEA